MCYGGVQILDGTYLQLAFAVVEATTLWSLRSFRRLGRRGALGGLRLVYVSREEEASW